MRNWKWVWGINLFVVTVFLACTPKHDPESDFRIRPNPNDGGNTIFITDYVGAKQDIRIPSRIQKKPVISASVTECD